MENAPATVYSFFLILSGYLSYLGIRNKKFEVRYVEKSIYSLVLGELIYHFQGRRYHQEEIAKSRKTSNLLNTQNAI